MFKSVGLLVFAVVSVVPSAFVTAEEVPAVPQLHYRERVASTIYEAFSALDVSQRRAVYSGLELNVRSQLWSIHLERFLMEHPVLTSNQFAAVQGALALVTDGVLETNQFERSAELRDRLTSLDSRARSLLPPEVALAALWQLGTPTLVAVRSRTRKIEASGFRNLPYCDCSVKSSWCAFWPTDPGGNCQAVNCKAQDGCGTLWSYVCDGLCP